MNVEEKVTDNLYERFDMEQYMKWYRQVKPERENKSIAHPLVDTQYMYVWNDGEPELVTIVSVVKHWHAGYYFHAVYENSQGSSGTVVIENKYK